MNNLNQFLTLMAPAFPMTKTGNLTVSLLKLRCFCILLMTLSGCSENKLSPLADNATIVSFGDSLTYGIGSTTGQTYPDALATLSGLTVINAGISGETTAQGLTRFATVIKTHTPALVILLEGGNDILRNYSSVDTKNNLAAMIEIAQNQQVDIVLIGVPEKKLFSDSAPLYTELANQYDLVFEEDLLSDLLRSPKYKSDPIHLNSSGYQKFAEGIYQILRNNGAIY